MKTEFLACLLYVIARVIGHLPWPVHHKLAHLIAWLWIRFDARESRVSWRNLELIYPNMSKNDRLVLHRKIVWHVALQLLEALRLWTTPSVRNLKLIKEVRGEHLFRQAHADGHGVIFAAPHFGNWELLGQWVAAQGPVSIVYRPPDQKAADTFLRRVRGIPNIKPIRADNSAVRQLLKSLRQGGTIGILPDQQPKSGSGEFAPFFGIEALTMTLLSRLAIRSRATVLFAWCERIDDSRYFTLHIERAPCEIAAADCKLAVTALNQAIERIACRDPAQYQWTYKRYTLRPPESGEPNPYERSHSYQQFYRPH